MTEVHDDTMRTAEALRRLDPQPRKDRWGHLSLCILSSTYSIFVRYDDVVVPLVRRYASYAGLSSVLLAGDDLKQPVSPRSDEQTLSQFLTSIENLDDEAFAAVLGSRHRTSPNNGILKSVAVRQIAQVLVEKHCVETLADFAELSADPERTAAAEEDLEAVKGAGQDGIRTGYIWMTAGDDDRVKPDRHVLRWLSACLGRRVSVAEARVLLKDAAEVLDVTPWSADHAIWEYQARPPQ
ncbi:hypothetical protein [Arthrobacter sp. 35/47]|uniref:hypothetical protein n=1 Tax=Arthrobacter sp. 35/47 TaxID=269454 RepID=UPI000687D9F7|nr:hypothetical protein [Arthrobacter sp. 35/47]